MLIVYLISTTHDNDPEVWSTWLPIWSTDNLEKILKRKNKIKEKKPEHDHPQEWNEALASPSEAAVKVEYQRRLEPSSPHQTSFQADRSQENPSELQSKTVETFYAQRSQSEVVNENGTSSTTAVYSRDEVSGPLSDAVGKEEVIVTQGKLTTDRAGADTILKTHETKWVTPSEEGVSHLHCFWVVQKANHFVSTR